MRRLGALPLAHQPGDSWTYNVSQDILGVLLERATGDDLGTVMRAELLGPIGMRDTGFSVSPEQQHLLADAYRAGEQGIELVDRGADSGWLREPQFRSGAGGLVGTANDWLEFGTMLLAGGVTADGTRLLSPDTVADMMTDHLTPQQRESGAVFLDGQGWGYGGSVDPGSDEPWSSPGRYGWVGASGTVAVVDPALRTVGVLMTQLETTGEESLEIIQRFWTFCRPPAV
ncbi:MAG: beta-lactamase family protein [Williamsia herbipolensis]|nr:beta-lactamase family protein [Williamsia herbipolensis]